MPVHVTPTPIVVGALPKNRGGLDLLLKEQVKSRWCWAACVQMVLKRLQPVPAESEQCQIAQKGLRLAVPPINGNVSCCTNSGNTPVCNKLLEDPVITKLWNAYGFEVVAKDDDLESDVPGTIETLVEALNRGNPIELGFSENVGHVVMLFRWEIDDDGTRRFIYHNPGPGSGSTVSMPATKLVKFGPKVLDATWEIRMPK